MSAAHTAGPWDVEADRHNGGKFTIKAGIYYIADTIGGFCDDEEMANAALIAAAPDLLAAMEDIADDYSTHEATPYRERYDRIVSVARAAIVKAKGGAL